jgi:hypothetical protein
MNFGLGWSRYLIMLPLTNTQGKELGMEFVREDIK